MLPGVSFDAIAEARGRVSRQPGLRFTEEDTIRIIGACWAIQHGFNMRSARSASARIAAIGAEDPEVLAQEAVITTQELAADRYMLAVIAALPGPSGS